MKFLTPLGLLGLLGILVLILIYIIKPNYQQKFVSSTYVWKLSLKYRKKRIPISKLRNILLIVCQILILTACALILAQPNRVLKEQIEDAEAIVILDASASMQTKQDDKTRFERAVDEILEFSAGVFDGDGRVSVILAGHKASFLEQQATKDTRVEFEDAMATLLEGETACTYGNGDIDGAILLSEEILNENPNAKIYIYTDSDYESYPKGIEIVNVSDKDEWNLAVLNATTDLYDGYYSFYVDVASYGRSSEATVMLDIYGTNPINNAETPDANGEKKHLQFTVSCPQDVPQRVVFMPKTQADKLSPLENVVYVPMLENEVVYSYDHVHVYVDAMDNLSLDDNYYIYNGRKEQIKVQYASSDPEIFFPAALATLKNAYLDRWDLDVREVKKGSTPSYKGYDLYIFEHTIPANMPEDGIVFLVNPTPNTDMISYGFKTENVLDFTENVNTFPTSVENEGHPILQKIKADRINVSKYVRGTYDDSFETLLSIDGTPVLSVRNQDRSKIVVMSFSVHFSSLVRTGEYVLLMNNVFNYFFPSTVSDYSFEVNETVELSARGPELTVTSGTGKELVINEFPATLTLTNPGSYTIEQTTAFGKEVFEQIYVTTPASESDITQKKETVRKPNNNYDPDDYFDDLLLYVAAALVALLFAEWWLQSREYM